MSLKLLDLNVLWGGRHLDRIIDFVKKEDFDILTFQEMAGGILSQNRYDSFDEIKNKLDYDGVLAKAWQAKEDKDSYLGVSIFWKKNIKNIGSDVVWLNKDFEVIENFMDRVVEEDPKNALSMFFEKDGKQFRVVTTHLAWGPTPEDKDYKLEQAKKLYEYLKNLNDPFILTGDFNLTPDSQVVKWMETLASNLTVKNKIENTLNFNVSSSLNSKPRDISSIYPPGLAVDYIFVSEGLSVCRFYLNKELDLSDHYPLILEFETCVGL